MTDQIVTNYLATNVELLGQQLMAKVTFGDLEPIFLSSN